MTGLQRLFALLCGLSLMTLVHADANNPAGQVKAETCRGCHSIESYKNVYPTYSVPRLAGQNKDYIVVALKAYRSGERSHATMQSQAASLSDQDMEDIAVFFSAQGGGDK